ncbi:MAG: hypothetical protein EA415_04030 [Sphaerobacteraceae bacterium]|nr:MAG: hypothetical protein EA415_04030 [Sphaerobacteraceae bacterium]
MRRGFSIFAGALLVLLAGVFAAAMIGRYTFNRSVNHEISDLFQRTSAAEPAILSEADIEHLPAPVQRWLHYSNVVGRERPETVRLKQEGEIRLGPDEAWMPFTAEQYYTTDPPSFIWKIDTSMMSVIPISGRDRYVDGRGNMTIKVASLIPVVDETGEHMDQGTLVRYLNEIFWFPAGAVSEYITWEAIDDNSAKAEMTYGGMTVEATFYFDDEGRPVNMMAPRYQDAGNGEIKWLPWWTPIHEYGEFDGVRMGVAGEAYWEEDWGDFTYVRLRLLDVEYNVPERY